MSFIARDLSVLAYANGFTLWHYRTRDSLADLLEYLGSKPPLGHPLVGHPLAGNDNGYFSPAHELLRPGDQITVNLIGPESVSLVHLVVARISGTGAVSVTPLLQPEPAADTRRAPAEQPDRRIYAA